MQEARLCVRANGWISWRRQYEGWNLCSTRPNRDKHSTTSWFVIRPGGKCSIGAGSEHDLAFEWVITRCFLTNQTRLGCQLMEAHLRGPRLSGDQEEGGCVGAEECSLWKLPVFSSDPSQRYSKCTPQRKNTPFNYCCLIIIIQSFVIIDVFFNKQIRRANHFLVLL